MKDRFTEAFKELEEKNAYICESCNDLFGHGREAEREHERLHEDPVRGCEGLSDR